MNLKFAAVLSINNCAPFGGKNKGAGCCREESGYHNRPWTSRQDYARFLTACYSSTLTHTRHSVLSITESGNEW